MNEKRVLLVDDNASDRAICKMLLEKNGFLVCEASDGFEALDQMEDEKFALFIIDLQMPRLPGLQLVRRLRQNARTKQTPILIMSGRNRPVDVQTAIQSGATDYMVKPMDLQVLEEKVNRLTKASSGDWKHYDVPETMRHARIGLFLEVLSLNEIGAVIRTPLQFATETTFQLNLEILESRGLRDMLVKVESIKKETENLVYFVRFVGISEADRRKIRLCCRELWVTKQAAKQS